MVHVHRDRPPAGDPVGYIRLLGRIFFQVVAGVVVVVLHLCFLFSLSPGSSIWRELTRLGGRAWKGLRLLLFLPVGSGEGPNWSLRSDASRNPAGDG